MTQDALTQTGRGPLDRPGDIAARLGMTGEPHETARRADLRVLSGDRSKHRAHAGEYEDLV